jgi:hypothetical protein
VFTAAISTVHVQPPAPALKVEGRVAHLFGLAIPISEAFGPTVSEDPSRSDAPLGLHTYVRSNPVGYDDPDGLEGRCIAASAQTWVSIGALGHRLGGAPSLFNLMWFDATCPKCKEVTNPWVEPLAAGSSERLFGVPKFHELEPDGRLVEADREPPRCRLSPRDGQTGPVSRPAGEARDDGR